jgi:hypothetical protein
MTEAILVAATSPVEDGIATHRLYVFHGDDDVPSDTP